jgi:integrase
MASLTFDKSGNAAVYVRLRAGGRRPVRLGNVGRQKAERIRAHISELESAALNGTTIDAQTRQWLADVTGDLRDRLAKCGLCESAPGIVGIGTFTANYLAQRVDVKQSTLIALQQARRHLVRYMGEDKPVQSVTTADADAYRADLIGRKMAKATLAKWCRVARHFFEVAKRRGMVQENPFQHIKGAVKGNPARRVFVPAADVQTVIDSLHDTEWKLLIALARFGGLRTPSESLALKWTDVDFEHRRFIVRASKTEHHTSGGVRVVPMFAELADLFQTAFDEAEPGSVYVISRYRDPSVNLRSMLVRYIERAGLKPWGKPWQNMRASRATELADKYPSHVCAAWLGHTEAIADEFYRTVTDEHFERASAPAVRNAVRAGDAQDCTDLPKVEVNCVGVHEGEWSTATMGDAGLEPATSTL